MLLVVLCVLQKFNLGPNQLQQVSHARLIWLPEVCKGHQRKRMDAQNSSQLVDLGDRRLLQPPFQATDVVAAADPIERLLGKPTRCSGGSKGTRKGRGTSRHRQVAADCLT